VERSGRRGAAQRSAGLLGSADERVGIVRMLGLFTNDALQRSLQGLQKLHTPSLHQTSKDVFRSAKGAARTVNRRWTMIAPRSVLRDSYLKKPTIAACSALKSTSSGPIFSSGIPNAAIAPASSALTSLEATIDSPVELTY